MKLVLFDIHPDRGNFHPLSLSRPLWKLRVGMSSLAAKLVDKLRPSEVACFVPPYMADSYRAKTTWKVNDASSLGGDDLVLLDGRIKADSLNMPTDGSRVGIKNGRPFCAFLRKGDLGRLKTGSIEDILQSASAALPNVPCESPTWDYIWELVLQNPQVLRQDFVKAGRSGVEGTVEQPSALRGSAKDVYVGKGARVHPMAVIDAANGPVYIDEEAEVHPFTRIEGPCYVGPKSILLGAKCREGMSIGPLCRVGGEVEESIIQGYSNKYHDGFLGHAYVGEWVNLGAGTTNSDLKNDYSSVSVCLDGKRSIDTGSTKVGSLIGDHTKTSIGTLFNTGSVVGAMAIILATGKPLPKFIPSFAWFLEGVVTKGFGRCKLYEAARVAMGRRKCAWTPAEQAMWDAIYELTAGPRDEAVRKGRKALVR